MNKRSTITVEQKFWWISKYGEAIALLRERNIGTCRNTGKIFSDIVQYFIISGNETFIIACPSGSLKIIGEAHQKKYDQNTNNSQVLINFIAWY